MHGLRSDDKDQAGPQTTETRALEDAQMAHLDRFGGYADERELVAAGLLPQASAAYEIFVSLDRQSHKIGPEAGPADQQTLTVGFQADPWAAAAGKWTFARFSLDTGTNETLTRLGDDYWCRRAGHQWEVITAGTNPTTPDRPTWRFLLRSGVRRRPARPPDPRHRRL